ncbi:MAG TPA: lysyl oxidase family protein [Bacteroidia bacterium]|nr:lysyl oxidase family protein [Bacteroidia bacterium]
MKKIHLLPLLLFLLPYSVKSQCSTTNATSCQCPPGGGTNCDLVPDISIARLPLNQSSNYTEYPQVCNPPCDGNDGRLRVGVSTPIIGFGPLETRGTAFYVCGTDTVDAGTVANIPLACPVTGLPPHQLINQRIYHKSGNTMTFWDREAGSMTYHPSHGHQHVDDWGIYTLRQNNGNPDPLNWPIIGTGSKLGYCLLDIGNCNSSSGYCTDSLGNTLNSSNIVNYGLGGGDYSCSNTVQGISNGYMDTYHQGLDGMWINLPAGLCDGTYYIVVQIDPYNYFLETNENNNVVAVPVTLTEQSATPIASVTANKYPAICSGDNITLSANFGTSYLWSNGATTQNIIVSNTGNYSVTVSNSCGSATSSPFAVTVLTANSPATTGGSVCKSGSTALTASGSGTINWYDSPGGGSSLFTGNIFNTPVVTTNTAYYADATVTSGLQTLFCPPADNSFGSGGYLSSGQYLIFDVIANCNLNTVKLYAQNAGSVTIQLQNSSGSVLNTATVNVTSGENTVTLNFALTAGSNYRLTRSGTFNLYRENAGANYPYNISGYISIKNSSQGTSFYYYFYNWKITTPGQSCTSTRSPATVTVHSIPVASITPNGPTTFCSGGNVLLSAVSGLNKIYQWKKNGVTIAGATSSSYNASASGNYKVTVTNSVTGCFKTTPVSTPVTVNSKPAATITPQGPISFCAGGSVQLNANTGAGLTYKWKKGGNYINGAVSNNYTANVAGTYKVEVTNNNGCSTTSSGITVTIPCKEVNYQNENDFYCEVHPNPSSEKFNIHIHGIVKENIIITIHDIAGREVDFSEERISDNEFRIGLINQGVYTAIISNGEIRQELRLIKINQ